MMHRGRLKTGNGRAAPSTCTNSFSHWIDECETLVRYFFYCTFPILEGEYSLSKITVENIEMSDIMLVLSL